eukprot:TRINITY_DN13_c0_g3_i8.p1 TRINITY_DN13_c0_g3~~TRINITY_DN13_c0_g3_i8.p1  ORF type:complete len:134 (-),score=38.91 TRINITY_DN13_c0_g3_i8:137-538(-)
MGTVVKKILWQTKMKVLAVLLLASYGLAHQAQSDYHQFKTWAEAKAMESCWGEENNKIYVVQMKKAVAKCKQQDAPELELPPFRSSYKFINYLISGANIWNRTKWNKCITSCVSSMIISMRSMIGFPHMTNMT